MSDSVIQRRQPPSPLVFSPETVLPPIPLQRNTSTHGSGSNTVSMPFIRRHVTRRLKTAKLECDRELQRVTNAITLFFEERLRAGDPEREREQRERDRDSQQGDAEPLREAFVLVAGELRSALQAEDTSSSDGGYEAELEGNRHSRQRASLEADSPTGGLTRWSSSPGLHAASVSSSPNALRRQNTLPKEVPPPATTSISFAPGTSGSSENSPRKTNASVPPTSGSWGSGPSSRRLSRSIHMPVRPVHSSSSSRSTSRSRSPLPPLPPCILPDSPGMPSSTMPSSSTNRRASRIMVDDPVDPIMSNLYALIAVATDIIDMSISQLTSQPRICLSLVQRVQNIGKAWDEHPDWHGRNWYVQVLLAVASLSRVVEWWEAEKQFWNFNDDDDEQSEPLTFVLKPVDEPAPTPTVATHQTGAGFKLSVEDEFKLRLTRPISQGRRSRDEARKEIGPLTQRDLEPTRIGSKVPNLHESARVLATERLRLQADQAQSRNIVLELSLDGDHFVWINFAWQGVVGTDPEDLIGTRISRLLSPHDWNVFKDATERLLGDDSHTEEIHFRLQVEPDLERDASLGILYREMEGKGMLMIDRVDGQPSHTMWVVKPIAPPEYDNSQFIVVETGDVVDEFSADNDFASRGALEPVTPFPFARPINTAVILCRICECDVPQWFFEKHNETCNEVHRLEADIGECNESIAELRNTIRELLSVLDRSSPVGITEYRGMPIFTSSPSPSSSPGPSSPSFRTHLTNKMRRVGIKKLQRRLLEELEDILQVASEIAMPSLKEEESKEPIERQRLLSPGSERKVTQVRTWTKPLPDDPALAQLAQDAEMLMRQKVDNVIRMQNTIKYSEKVRREWEEKVEQTLSSQGDHDQGDVAEEDDGDEASGDEGSGDDHSSTTSEYAFGSDAPSADPTPMASASPTPSSGGHGRALTSSSVSFSTAPSSYGQGMSMYTTRSSTPSSISSPLALAAPINASTPEPETLHVGDPLDDGVNTLRGRKSIQNLHPKTLLTPPISPMVSPRDVATSYNSSRRHSVANPLQSPTAVLSGHGGPLSPRIPSVAPSSRTTPTSIKDFDIIKPISKGAFGSVFLAKKKVTGDYYAIKVLKKADMIAKNQITNVKAERMILMKQAESPFVAKLYFTFQSKENLYLVMEYLNGGDCAALIKSIGSLPEEWTKNYIAEVVLGLEYLHQRGVIHRDLKPDNLLIDQQGHLKLTDFGLSRIGLLGRQTRDVSLLGDRGLRTRGTRYSPGSRPPSIDAAYLSSPIFSSDLVLPGSNAGGSYFFERATPGTNFLASHLASGPPTDDISESSGSESLSGFFLRRPGGLKSSESPLQSFATDLATDLRSHPTSGGGGTPPAEQKFVGTPDYLAPESILGLSGDDMAVDWWALGVITYEFLYGIPPFHAETPEKVFENILSGHIEWHEDWVDFSEEARDFMQRLMTLDPIQRLGTNGAEEVKAHPFLAGIEWDKVTTTEAAFIPQVTDPESTDYFDPRGAIPQLFHDEEHVGIADSPDADILVQSNTAPILMMGRESTSSPSGTDDFGSFSFKNLPVLKQANDDVIRKMRTDQMAPMVPMVHTLTEPANIHSRRRSVSQKVKKPSSVVTSIDTKGMTTSTTNPPSPTTSTSSIASSPSRGSIGPSTPGSAGGHGRKPSEFGAVERFKLSHFDNDGMRRNSMPSRLRTASVSSAGEGSVSDSWPASTSIGQPSSHFETTTPPSSVTSLDLRRGSDPLDRAVTCLLAEDNPITAKIIETLLIRLGCRCVVVADGSEAVSVALGDIKFDLVLMDLHMPVIDGEQATRYIKSTNNKNTSTPIIAISAYSGADVAASNLFAASLAKPVQKADLLAVLRQLGFKTSTQQDGPATTKVVPR